MEKKLKNKITNILICGFELSIAIILLTLEYLSGYKAGVMKHLYFKKIKYLSEVYTRNGMITHLSFLLILFLVLVFIYKNQWDLNSKKSIGGFILLSILLVVGFYLPYMKTLNTYPYILVFLEISIMLKAVKMIINSKTVKFKFKFK